MRCGHGETVKRTGRDQRCGDEVCREALPVVHGCDVLCEHFCHPATGAWVVTPTCLRSSRGDAAPNQRGDALGDVIATVGIAQGGTREDHKGDRGAQPGSLARRWQASNTGCPEQGRARRSCVTWAHFSALAGCGAVHGRVGVVVTKKSGGCFRGGRNQRPGHDGGSQPSLPASLNPPMLHHRRSLPTVSGSDHQLQARQGPCAKSVELRLQSLPTEPGVGSRHHLPSRRNWLGLLGHHHRPVQPQSGWMGP